MRERGRKKDKRKIGKNERNGKIKKRKKGGK